MHAIDILLGCRHINIEQIEAAIFVPRVGEIRICNVCGKQTIIAKVGTPYWIDERDVERMEREKR